MLKELTTVSQEEWDELQENHLLWLRHEGGSKLVAIHKNLSNVHIPSGAELSQAEFRYCEMEGMNLQGVDFSDTFLCVCSFENADLRETQMQGAVISSSSFNNADMRGALLSFAAIDTLCCFDKALLNPIDARRVNLTESQLAEIDFGDWDTN